MFIYMIYFSLRYLIEHGGNVAAVNNDGELPVDIAESDEMEDMLQQQIDDIGRRNHCLNSIYINVYYYI